MQSGIRTRTKLVRKAIQKLTAGWAGGGGMQNYRENQYYAARDDGTTALEPSALRTAANIIVTSWGVGWEDRGQRYKRARATTRWGR